MDEPYFLEDPTIFGAANGKLLGGGEAGSELVVGTNKLMDMMKAAVGSRSVVINVYGAEGQDIRALAQEVSRELQNAINDKERVYA
jgi:phage-related minor tail protein